MKIPGAEPETELAADTSEIVFEPSPEAVLGYLLSHYLNIYIYQILLNAKASEQSARMVSMKNATDNADSLIKDLTLEYNKLRQGNITKELLEIAGGQAGLIQDSFQATKILKAGLNMNKGKIVQVIGPVVDVEFPDTLPAIYNALTVEYKVSGPARQADARSAAAPRRQLGAHHLHVRHRRSQARLRGHGYRRADLHARRRRRHGPRVRRDRQPGGRARAG